MIGDTSAILAILMKEQEQRSFIELLAATWPSDISAGTWIELAAVVTRGGSPELALALRKLMAVLGIGILPVSAEQARLGFEAYRNFGRGTGHAAALTFGDCFAYALAKESGRPLLFKGEDFAATDVVSAA